MKNWKQKIAAAALAAVVSVPASAALVDTSGQNSSLFLTVWNSAASYTRDLGTTLNGFLSPIASSTTVFAGDSLFASTFGGNLTGTSWNIVAGDSVFVSGSNPTRLLTTAAYGSSPTANRNGMNTSNIGGINNEVSIMNGAGCSSAASCTVLSGAPGDGGSAAWGTGINGGMPFSTVGGAGSQLAMYLLSSISGNAISAANVSVSTFTGAGAVQSYWTLASNGTATWNVAAPAAVPVPAAAWLLGSGLFGLVGVARRKQKTLA